MTLYLNRGKSISASSFHVLGVKNNGKVVAVGTLGDPWTGSLAYVTGVSAWTNIIQVVAVNYCSIGLTSSGSVVAIGNTTNTCASTVSTWTNVIQIAGSESGIVGVKSDGTVYSTAGNTASWTNIVAADVSSYGIIGVKADGTVIGTNSPSWTNIVGAIVGNSSSYAGSVGVQSNRTLVYTGSNINDLAGYTTGAVALASGVNNFGVLYANGTIRPFNTSRFPTGWDTWTDIKGFEINANYLLSNIYGVKSNGTVVALGNNDYNQLGAASWTDIVVPTEYIAPPATPTTPTNLGASSITNSSFTLGWTAVSGATSYKVFQNSTSSPIATPGTNSQAISGLSANTTNTYYVSAVNSGGESALSSSLNVLTKPNAPTALSQTASTANSVTVTWTASANGAVSYKIYRSGSHVATVTPPTVSATITGLTANNSYPCYVTAANTSGESAPSNQITILTALATPSGLSISPVSSNSMTLNWTAVPGADFYWHRVNSSDYWVGNTTSSPATVSPGQYYTMSVRAENYAGAVSAQSASVSQYALLSTPTNLATSNVTATSMTFSWNTVGLATYYIINVNGSNTNVGNVTSTSISTTPGTEYTLSVRAYNSNTSSAQSSSIIQWTPSAALPAPTNVSLQSVHSTYMWITWNSVVGANKYSIYVNNIYQFWVTSDTTVAAVTGLTPGSVYSVTVTATDVSNVESPQSSPLIQYALLSTPTNLATSNVTETSMTFSWNTVSLATYYIINVNGSNTNVGNVTSTSISTTPGTQYTLSVRAYNTNTSSAQSDSIVQWTPSAALPAPTYVDLYIYWETTSIGVVWGGVEGAVSYKVYVNGLYNQTVIDNTVTIVTGLTPGTYYSFTVTAINASAVESEHSAPFTITTKLEVPENLTASDIQTTQFTLNWDMVSSANLYYITKDGSGYNLTANTYAVISGLTPGSSSTMRVRAENSSTGAFSNYTAPLIQYTLLATPTGLTTTDIQTTQVSLAWNTVSGATNYDVYTNNINPQNTNTNSITVTGLMPETSYTFKVVAKNVNTHSSDSTPIVVATASSTAAYLKYKVNDTIYSVPLSATRNALPALAIKLPNGLAYAKLDTTTNPQASHIKIQCNNTTYALINESITIPEWSALASDMNNTIYTLTVSNNELYAGGNFTTAGGVSANRIAKWNGSTWSALGTGANNIIYSLATFNNELYAGGSFTTINGISANRIAKWNGSTWSALGTGASNIIYSLATFNNELYAGGYFTTINGISADRIAKWNGSTWSAVGTGMDGFIGTLAVFNNELYAGGDFNTAGGVSANKIAKWNGSTWSAVGTGMNMPVGALSDFNNELYAGGYFTTADGAPATRIARWNGSSWLAMGDGMNNGIHAFAVFNNELYAGGAFTTADGTPAIRIAKWNGSTWSTIGTGMNNTVNALAVFNNELYAGGNFTVTNELSTNYIAKFG